MGFSDSLFAAIDEIFQAVGRYDYTDDDKEELITALVILRKIEYKHEGFNKINITDDKWRNFIKRLYNRARREEYGFNHGISGEDFYDININDPTDD